MPDTPSLEEALDKARTLTTEEGDKIQEDNPEDSEEKDEPVKTDKSEKVDEPEDKKSKKAEQPTEKPKESKKDKEPIDHIDPNDVPEDIKPWYNKIMAGFTKGRQKDREEVNTLKKQIEELKQARPEVEEEDLPKFDTPEQYYAWQAKKTAEEVVKNERKESFRQEALNYYNAFDPRLNEKKEDGHDPIVDTVIGSQLDEELDKFTKENGSEVGFDYKNHIKRLVGEWDQYIESQIKNYIERQNKLTREKAKEFQKKSPVKSNPAKTSLSKKMTLGEAMKAALEKTS